MTRFTGAFRRCCRSASSSVDVSSSEGGGGKVTRGPYVVPDSLTDEWRYEVESIVDAEWLRVVVELPDDPPSVIVVTVIEVE
jgi:hypothetical protein